MGPGRDLDMLGELGVPSDRAVMRPVHPDDLSQQMSIRGIRLRPRRRMPLPIARHLHRVDRIDGVTGGQQRLHPRPPLGLDPNLHLIRLARRVKMFRDQLVQRGDSGQSLRQPPPGQQPPGIIFDLDVVIGLSPIVADKQHSAPPLVINRSEPRRRPATT